MQYPAPSHAVTVWLGPVTNGISQLAIGLPPSEGNTSPSMVHLPCTPEGMAALERLLKARAMSQPTAKIGTPAVPLQSMIEALRTTSVQPRKVEASADDVDELSAALGQLIALRKRVAELSKTMQCNCDLDNWQPESSTGHSHVCRIHKAAIAEI